MRAVTSGCHKLCAAHMVNRHMPLQRSTCDHWGLKRILGDEPVRVYVERSGIAGFDVCAVLLVCAHDAEGRRRDGGNVDLSLQCAGGFERPDVCDAPYVMAHGFDNAVSSHKDSRHGQHWTSRVQGTGHGRDQAADYGKARHRLELQLDGLHKIPTGQTGPEECECAPCSAPRRCMRRC